MNMHLLLPCGSIQCLQQLELLVPGGCSRINRFLIRVSGVSWNKRITFPYNSLRARMRGALLPLIKAYDFEYKGKSCSTCSNAHKIVTAYWFPAWNNFWRTAAACRNRAVFGYPWCVPNRRCASSARRWRSCQQASNRTGSARSTRTRFPRCRQYPCARLARRAGAWRTRGNARGG